MADKKTSKKVSPGQSFAEACRELAQRRAGRTDLEVDEGEVCFFHPCPLSNHEWKGPRPSAWTTKDGRTSKCHRCTEDEDGRFHDDLAGYRRSVLDDLKLELGWEEGSAAPTSGVEVLRWHDYETHDGRFTVRHLKLKKKNGNAEPYWGFSTKDNSLQGFFARFEPCGKGDLVAFRERHYPELSTTYHMVHFYQHQRFRGQDGSPKDLYRLALMEGERDAETFNALMASAGSGGLIATALPNQTVNSFAPHQRELMSGKPLILIGDNDKTGRQIVEHWSAAAWGVASSIKVFPSEVFGEKTIERGQKKGTVTGRDFSEWVEVERAAGRTDREVANEIVCILTRTEELVEPLAQPKGWKQKLRTNQKGGISSTNLLNAKIAWTEHPMLAGRLWLNIMTAEVEVHDPPWFPGEVVAGAKRAASSCSMWLDEDHEVCLSSAALEEAAWIAAQPRNPHDDLLAEPWDGTPRLDGLFTRYLPLNVGAAPAVSLARIFLGDLAAKASGRLVRQRLVVGIGTSLDIDIARALVGIAGAVHQGTVRDGTRFTRRSKILVQTSMEPIADKRVALTSLPVLFAEGVWHDKIGMHVPSPAFIAVGEMPSDPRTVAQMSDHCFALALAGKPMMESLEEDAPQIMAEAMARMDELLAEREPSKDDMTTLDEEIERRSYELIYQTVHQFSTRILLMNRPATLDTLADAPPRHEPLDHVVREQWLLVMGPMLMTEWRKRSEIISAFNKAMKRANLPNRVTVTPGVAEALHLPQKTKKRFFGTYLGRENREKLEKMLDEGASEKPGVTWEPLESRGGHDQKPRKTAGESRSQEARAFLRGKRNETPDSNSFPHVRAPDIDSKRVGPEEEAGEIITVQKITDGAHVETVRDGDAWMLRVGGVEADPAAVAAELLDWPSWEDPPRLVTTDGASLRAWLAEVGAEAGVEEIA